MNVRLHLQALVYTTLLLSVLVSPEPRADDATASSDPVDERTAAFAAANDVAQVGPVRVTLRDQAVLNLPEGFVFIPTPAAERVMTALGNSVNARLLGLVFPNTNENWFVVAEYEPSGYIKDDDAKQWDVNELFTNIKEGTEAANAERHAAGFAELDVVGWIERPAYDTATHRLVWSLSARDRAADPGALQTINYNTYLLGREGYVSLNLVTDSAAIESSKDRAKTLLGALEFQRGKTYTDFAPDTDKVAAYGVGALIGGIAAHKLGMFALAAAFFAKFAKVLVLVGAVVVAAIAKLFRSRNKPDV